MHLVISAGSIMLISSCTFLFLVSTRAALNDSHLKKKNLIYLMLEQILS